MMFGQLKKCLSLREIDMGIDQAPEFLSDIGLVQSPAKSTMSDGNAKLDYRAFCLTSNYSEKGFEQLLIEFQ